MKLSTLLATVVSALVLGGPAALSDDFTHYESSHVHPLALDAEAGRLVAVNTPEARLALFDVDAEGSLVFVGDVPVGLEPVSVALRPGTPEAWVVNHLSDSVSVIDTAAGRLVATLSVGDEPTDVVFASGRAFISLAGNNDHVVVYEAESRERVTAIAIPGDDPRAMAATADGSRVVLVVLESGNRTTSVHRVIVEAEGGPPAPDIPRDPALPGDAPPEGVIVQLDPATGRWEDETGDDWSAVIPFDMPDHDLFVIDALAPTPTLIQTVRSLGTALFDVAIHPITGAAWVPNTEARNRVRFEPKLRGHLVETRVSIADLSGTGITRVDLNSHIDTSTSPGPPEEIAMSLAQPGDGEFSSDGQRFYLTAFGSAKVAVLDGSDGSVLRRLATRGGPSGLALNEAADRLYVMSRFENTISVLDTISGDETSSIGVAGPSGFDPSPPEVRNGRRLLYDGQLSSGHGDLSCATCHLFANFDGLAWDLGDPQGAFVSFAEADWVVFDPSPSAQLGFDPMKGAIVTQTLRGLLGNEPFHWRGDRRNFQHFNGAFVSLLGRGEPLPNEQMDAFADFIMTVEMPPNPNRLLDDSLNESLPLPHVLHPVGNAARGRELFVEPVLSTLPCVRCHAFPSGSTNTLTAAVAGQDIKIPQLRNVYEKVAFDPFRSAALRGGNIGALAPKGGFGVLHDGALSLLEFLGIAFQLKGEDRADVTAFLHSFPTRSFPCVGHQLTMAAANAGDEEAGDVMQTLILEAEAGHCDLVAKGRIDGADVGYVYDPAQGRFLGDSENDPIPLEDFGEGDVITFTGVPPGNGTRLGVDRDRDGCLDGDELLAGTDPAGPGVRMDDGDGDGIADAFDLCPGWVQEDRSQTDSDGDGTPDECACGDLDDDGFLTHSDLWRMFLHLWGYTVPGTAIEKCNVVGPAGNEPELCTRRDLRRLARHLHRGVPLEQACLPDDPPLEPIPQVCADAAF